MLDENVDDAGAGESGLENKAQEQDARTEFGAPEQGSVRFHQALERAKEAGRNAKSKEQRNKATKEYIRLLKTGEGEKDHQQDSQNYGKVPYSKQTTYSSIHKENYHNKNPQAPGKGKSEKPSE